MRHRIGEKSLLLVASLIDVLQSFGLRPAISQAKFFNFANDKFIVTVSIMTKDGQTIAQGISLGEKDEATCLALFESVERLYFASFHEAADLVSCGSPEILRQSLFKLYDDYQLLDSNFQKTNHIDFKFGQDGSTGWAFGTDIESTCIRAKNEIIERIVFNLFGSTTENFKINSVETTDLGRILSTIAKSNGYCVRSLSLKLDEDLLFMLTVMHDPIQQRTFLGASVGNKIEELLNKTITETLVDYYYGDIAKDAKIQKSLKSFNYLNFSLIYEYTSGLQNISLNQNSHNFSSLTSSSFAFRVFPVKNKLRENIAYIVVASLEGNFTDDIFRPK